MSTIRRKSSHFLGKGPNGRNLCFCGCGREVQSPRLNWFSDACVTAWKEKNDPAYIRMKVEERDHGICALCGADTELNQRVARETRPLWSWLAHRHAEELFWRGELPLLPWQKPGDRQTLGDCWSVASRWVEEDTVATFGRLEGHTWEADHIIPVIEGGGQCGLENYRTLCLKCHRAETAKLAKRRAEARKRSSASSAAREQTLELSLP